MSGLWSFRRTKAQEEATARFEGFDQLLRQDLLGTPLSSVQTTTLQSPPVDDDNCPKPPSKELRVEGCVEIKGATSGCDVARFDFEGVPCPMLA